MNISAMKVKNQLFLGFGFLLGLFLLMLGYTFYVFGNLEDAVNLAVFDRYPKTVKISQINENINKVARATRTMLLSEDKTVIEDQINVVKKSRSNAGDIMLDLEKTIVTDQGRKLFGKIMDNRKIYGAGVDKFMQYFEEGKKDQARVLLLGEIRESQHAYQKSISEFQSLLNEQMTSAGEGAVDSISSSKKLLSLLVLLGFGCGAAVAMVIVKNLTRQLGGEPAEAADVAARIAAGDLSSVICVEGNNAKSMMASMKQMQISLDKLIGEIKNIVSAAESGDFTKKISLNDKSGFGLEVGKSLNSLMDTTYQGLNDIQQVASALADGDLSQKITRNYPGLFGKTSEGVNLTVDSLNKVIQEVRMIVDAASEGDFSHTMDASAKKGYPKILADLLNRLSNNANEALSDISRVASAMGQGDLTVVIDKKYPGLFGKTADGINVTSQNLKNLVGNIVLAVGTIDVASQEISAGNRDLSARTEEQASSLEETAASLEEFTTMMQHNNESARQASDLAEAASNVATKGGSVVTASVQTMEDIATSSRKISDIISVIDGIAFQTNILALNAAVEAARAGEQGRGFAVVASEVRNLALRAAGAAKEIKDLITESVDKVERGTAQAEEAGKTMEEIVSSIAKVATIITSISHASLEQAAGITQINKAVSAMDEVTQQNAAQVEQVAAAAESLESQARDLQGEVSRFKLNQTR